MKLKRIFLIILAGLFLFEGGSIVFNNDCNTESTAYATSSATIDETLVQTYQAQTSIINPPTVICDGVNSSVVDFAINSSAKPSNIILRFDKNGNIVDEKGGVIDSFLKIYEKLNHTIIPIVRVEDDASANAFINFMQTQINILDIAVLSSKPALVKKVRNACEYVRGIIFWAEGSFASNYEILSQTNQNFANVVLLPQSLATQERVEYIQARLKTVWVVPEENTNIYLRGCINSGAYGIVTSDFSMVYDIMETYPVSLVRPAFNIAHRGLPNKYNENSLSAVNAVLQLGITHIEMDGQLTSDGKILMMHDDDIADLTTGSGCIKDMTYEEARSYKLDLFGLEDIPSLDEVMSLMKEKGGILVFEIKSNIDDIVLALKQCIEKYDFWEQIVVITFYSRQLKNMRDILPQVPTAYLETVNKWNFVSGLKWMGEYNTGMDNVNTWGTQDFNEGYLRDRGIAGWYWTYRGYSEIEEGVMNGHLGITNNDADLYCEEIYSINVAYTTLHKGEKLTLARGDEIGLVLTKYNGTQESVVMGQVEWVKTYDDYYGLIASYKVVKEGGSITYFTPLIKIEKSMGDDSVAIMRVIFGVIIDIIAVIFLIYVFRKIKRNKEKNAG